MSKVAQEPVFRSLTLVCIGVFLGLVLSSAGVEEALGQTVWPKKQWRKADPSEQGMDPSVLDALNKRIRRGEFGYVDQLVVIRNGHLVFDETYDNDYVLANADRDPSPHQYNYYNPNWHPFYHGTDLHTLQSITKSVTSAVVGIAVGRGDLPAVDTGVFASSGGRPAAGLGPGTTDLALDDSPAAWPDLDWGEFAFPVDEYTRTHLFRPLGIKKFYWKRAQSGLCDTETGLYLTAHDLARIGYLYLNDGVWNETRILPQGWVQSTLRPATGASWLEESPGSDGYGYHWWVVPHRGARPTQMLVANGYGGQFLFVVPERNLIAVFTGWNIYRPVPSIKDAFTDYVLRAVVR